MRLQRLEVVARLLTIVAAAAAAAYALIAAVTFGQFALAVCVLGTLLLRLQAPTGAWRHAGAIGLVLAVAAVVGATGGLAGPATAALLLVIGDYGLARPTRTVALVGIAAAGTAIGAAAAAGRTPLDEPSWVWILALAPLAGAIAGLLGGRQSMEGTAALESATSALDEVLALAERIPAGFDRWSVATAVHLEMLEASGLADSPGGTTHLLLVQQGVLFGVGTPIARRPVGLLADVPRRRMPRTWLRVDHADLPLPLRDELEGHRWYLHRLEREGTSGIVLVPASVSRQGLEAVREVLRPAAVALANVERFERLEDVAIHAARTRVAHDLHDGVAQALTHVRFELDLLALEHGELEADIERIRGVADAALLEVRRTVGELRDSAPLATRIARHVELLSTFATTRIALDVPAAIGVDDHIADDVFRVVQEALSNVVRHARASSARVTMVVDEGSLTLTVVDDGCGVDATAAEGVGMTGMHSRARRLGGTLLVRPRRGGGTVVQLDVPVGQVRRQHGTAPGAERSTA